MNTEMEKAYNPKGIEEKWYNFWETNGYFTPENLPFKNSSIFSIVIPPPNVTGALHMGHALDNTLQDIVVRYKRMKGLRVLWVPGTDHAGIATQNVVEKSLLKEGIKKEDLGREKFLEKVWEWKEKYGNNITSQLRRLGASCDWTRERFTMDEGLSKAVRRAFVTLYKEGLIYKGRRMVNWCPRCTTAISDIEVEHETKKGHLWYIKYPLADKSGDVVVATTRPETMLGDTAVAVNPTDERYKHLVGRMLTLPLVNRKIPIIADEFVDPSFGTGAVKVTPAHDPNDFDIAQRHNLNLINIFTETGHIKLDEFTFDEKQNLLNYEGLSRTKAREQILEDLEKQNLLAKIEEYSNNVGKCYRCKTEIEPYLSDQWFVKVAPLAKEAIEAVENGNISFIPERWTKVYLDWMKNLKDWCISRQIWWGHRIPVWYCDCGEIVVSETDPEKCPSCGNKDIKQDEDVLDTWFSSSLWPFSTLGWPNEESLDLKTYYPTTLLVTGYDIITFWVSKMIMMGLHFMKKEPFKKVYIHGLIRDITGKKMSKSLGNVIDPLNVIDSVGADALRFALVTLVTAQGQDLKLSEEKITEGRNFVNKIWNVSRFVLMQQNNDGSTNFDKETLSIVDKWILSKYNKLIIDVTKFLEGYDFGEAARILYDFIWDKFCDWYVELSKVSLYESKNSSNTLKVLNYILTGVLKLLHPFMPFVSEEIFSRISKDSSTIMLQSWPIGDERFFDDEAEKQLSLLMAIIRAVRNIKAEMNIPANKEIDIIIVSKEKRHILEPFKIYFKSLLRGKNIQFLDELLSKPLQSALANVELVQVYVPLVGLIDIEKEKLRQKKLLEEVNKFIEITQKKLSDSNFVTKAKQDLVENERNKLQELFEKKKIIEDRLKNLDS